MSEEDLRALGKAHKEEHRLDEKVHLAYGKSKESVERHYNDLILDLITRFGRTPLDRTQASDASAQRSSGNRLARAFRILMGWDT